MREFELTFILGTDIPEDEHSTVINQLIEWISGFGGTISNAEIIGRRKLAYTIAEYTEGYYGLINFEVEQKNILELERELKLYTKLMRYLIVRAMPRKGDKNNAADNGATNDGDSDSGDVTGGVGVTAQTTQIDDSTDDSVVDSPVESAAE